MWKKTIFDCDKKKKKKKKQAKPSPPALRKPERVHSIFDVDSG
jgi:hypothetical protein